MEPLMGHTEIARLPTSQRWQIVTNLLHSPRLDARSVAGAVTVAAQRRLRDLNRDPSLTYCFWLLTQLASAARGDDFLGDVAALGIPAQPDDTVSRFLARVADHTRAQLADFPESGPFGDIAATALRQALAETVGTHGRTLFGSSVDELVFAFQRYSTPTQFGDLAQRFFAAFMGQTLRYYLDREIPHAIGGDGLIHSGDASTFTAALDRHARELARVVEAFAIGWYDKHHWERLGSIPLIDAQGFVGHALPKLRGALVREAKR
jgi:hypothetical protein